MKLTGGATVHATAAEVWATLNDTGVLTRAIPGCEHLERTAPGSARFTVTAAVASTAGTYTGEATLTGSQPPHSLAIAIEAQAEPGTLTATLAVRLAEASDASTALTYEADAEVTGMLAAVGRALLTSAATRLATQFFESLDEALTTPRQPAGTSREGRSPTGAAGVTSGAPAAGPGQPAGQGRRSPVGAAGVAYPWVAGAPRASGATTEAPTAMSQPAGLLGAAPPAGPLGAAPPRRPGKSFPAGVLIGAALGVAAAKLGSILARNRRP